MKQVDIVCLAPLAIHLDLVFFLDLGFALNLTYQTCSEASCVGAQLSSLFFISLFAFVTFFLTINQSINQSVLSFLTFGNDEQNALFFFLAL